jgi:hypothetical protein
VSEADSGIASIALHFGAGAAIGDNAQDGALAVAGMPRRVPKPAVFPFNLPPGVLTAVTVGSFLDLSEQFGPPTGWFWDVTSIALSGFTSGAVAVSKNAPYVTPAGNPVAVEPVTFFNQAGIINFPQKGTPLLDGGDRLVFTVTATITGVVQVSGTVIAVPVCRMDEYLS